MLMGLFIFLRKSPNFFPPIIHPSKYIHIYEYLYYILCPIFCQSRPLKLFSPFNKLPGFMQATMSAVESYGAADNNNNNNNGPTNDNMGPTFDGAAAVYNPVIPPPQLAAPINSYPGGVGAAVDSSGGAPQAVSGEKRKRGRPRKYSVDGTAAPPVKAPVVTPNGKRMGRPPGSGKKQQALAASMGSSGLGISPQIITVQTGEDVSSKIMSFSQNGSQAVCILSANGAISNVTLRQASSCGGTVTYEGRFEILSLSGSYIMIENGGQRSRTGGLNVLLAGPDGRVLGGGVAGLFIAATPVQVVIGAFAVGHEPKSANRVDYSAAPPKPIFESPTVMRGTTTPSESSGSPPINHSNDNSNPNNNNNNHNSSMGMMQWK